jgi:putative hydrolase
MAKEPTNTQIADVLEEIADILELQDANPFRVRAYHTGAQSVRSADQSVADLVRHNQYEELKDLPGIGEGIAAVIGEYVTSGHSSLLEDLRAKAGSSAVFVKVPGIGPELAERIVEHLHINTLPELEEAAHDGRLETVEGFGNRRVAAVRAALAGMLNRSARTRSQMQSTNGKNHNREEQPSVELLLEIDADYRKQAATGDLPTIAPRRFNPENESWLPVMHTKREGWDFTVLFSNTAQAHKLGKTDDWVVIYYERDGREHQNTVVTETRGALEGKRVVRGREAENRRYYTAAVK